MPPNYSFILILIRDYLIVSIPDLCNLITLLYSNLMACRSIFTVTAFQFVHVTKNLSCLLSTLASDICKIAAVTFKDNYVIMTSLVTSCRSTRRVNLIVSVTDGISLLNF